MPLYNIGIAYEESGNYLSAINYMNQVLAIDINYNKAWYNNGINYYNLGNIDLAINSFEKADGFGNSQEWLSFLK